MGLFKPFWMTDKWEKAEAAEIKVAKIQDQELLKRIVTETKWDCLATVALRKITDDAFLFDVAKNYSRINYSYVRKTAIEMINNQHLLEKLVPELENYAYTYKDEEIEALYKKLDNPPFEWTLSLKNELAEARLVHAVENMHYPEDEELLKTVIEKANTDKGRQIAIAKLPYDRKYFESALRYNRSLAFVHTLACVLPDDSDLLDKRICSNCGAVDSVESFSIWIPRKDDYDKGFKCKECGHRIGTNGNWELDGKEDFSMVLREFRNEAYTEIAKRKKHGW